jgi:hypothetical protein
MEILSLKGTEETPTILLDKDKGVFEISGRSLKQNSAEFYRPVLEWIGNYAVAPNSSTHFSFKLEYFNTATSKAILDVLNALKSIMNTKIIWYFHDDDEDMEEEGQDFSELVDIPFEFKTY